MSDEKKHDQPTLTDFIDKNHKLISTAGILATISVLVNRLPWEQYGPLGSILSCGLFVMVFMICLEILGNFPWTEHGKVYWFRQIFVLVTFEFFVVWISTFYKLMLAGLMIVVVNVIGILIFIGCLKGIRRLVIEIPWFKRLNQPVKESIPLFGAMALFAAVLAILSRFMSHFKLIH